MSKQLKEFAKQIDYLKAIINEKLTSVPDLAGYEFESLSLKPLESEPSVIIDKLTKKNKSSFKGNLDYASNILPRICTKANGKQYLYYGPGPCPAI